MLRGRLHDRGADGRCTECGEPFPCSLSIDMREMSHQVVPSTTVHAGDFEQQLRPIYEALKAFERDLRNRPNQDQHEVVRADAVAVAIEHLQQAIDALEVASRE